jgi:hypothetical protein
MIRKRTKNTRNRAIVVWITALFLVVITFSPVILNPGKKDPALLSMPFTLWTGMAATILLVLLAYISSRFRNKL